MSRAIIAAGIASLYADPVDHAELDDEVLFGMEVEVLSEPAAPQDGWLKIRTPYRYEGYVHSSGLVLDEAISPAWTASAFYITVRPWVDIKKGPEVQAETILSIPAGSLIAIPAWSDTVQWQGVLLPDGREGFLPATYLRPRPRPWQEQREADFRDGVVTAALSYLGTQYRWGGKTHLGIDCSGLASMSYMLNGCYTNRNSKFVTTFDIHEIKREAIKKGDLIYFSGHIAIYLGDNRFIHSTGFRGTEGVCICGMEPGSPGYREDLMGKITQVGSLF
jgi:cell wall-associated NlpC family hydrolase